MHAVGGNGSYNWSLFSGTFPGTISLNSDGTFSSGFASTTTVSPVVVVIQVTDGTNTTQGTFYLSVQNSGLSISAANPMVVTSGRLFGAPQGTLTASGSLNTPYSWSISPLSASQLPTGLTLTASAAPSLTAIVSGTTSATGFSQTVTFRVTDNVGAYYDAPILVQVQAGLALHAGPDYADNIVSPLGILGYVSAGNTDSIATSNNQPFRVVATNVISTNPSTISITTSNPSITGVVDVLDTVHGVAYIHLHGPFSLGSLGSNSLSVTVVDSGVGVTRTFTWWVYNDGVFRIAPSTGSLPIQTVS
jgi:hypothetical protein